MPARLLGSYSARFEVGWERCVRTNRLPLPCACPRTRSMIPRLCLSYIPANHLRRAAACQALTARESQPASRESALQAATNACGRRFEARRVQEDNSELWAGSITQLNCCYPQLARHNQLRTEDVRHASGRAAEAVHGYMLWAAAAAISKSAQLPGPSLASCSAA